MDEKNNYVNLLEQSETPLSWRDYAAPAVALALSLLYWAVFSAYSLLCEAYGPGLGILVFVGAYYAAVLLMLGPRWDGGGIFLMMVSVCLALCCTLYCHEGFNILNCFLILLTASMATFRFSGQACSGFLTLRAIPETVEMSIFALFSRIAPPWKRLRLRRADAEKTARTVTAVLASAALLAVVLALLASADMVFGSFFQDIGDWIAGLSLGTLIWKLLRIGALTLFILSGLYFIRTEPRQNKKERDESVKPVIYFLMPSILLDTVYAVFCALQLRYLFGGAEAAAMAGGWAEYARTGFFQLVAVAAINLTLCGAGANKLRFAEKGGSALRVSEAVMLVLTAVILLSAARRMQLYILAFGMSVLRLITLWGMIVAAVGILAAGYKLIRPAFLFFPVLFGFALSAWCVLCLMNPAGQVANYNVDAYLDGRLEAVDVYYLGELTPDAAKALERLAKHSEKYRKDALETICRWHDADGIPWGNWKAGLIPDFYKKPE